MTESKETLREYTYVRTYTAVCVSMPYTKLQTFYIPVQK